jgi:uncharacterized protein YjbI with pentapeptide repeats
MDLDDRRPLVVGVLGLAAELAILLWIIPHIQVPGTEMLGGKERIELRDKSRATLAQILGGSLLLVGIFTASENLRSSRESEFTDRLIRCVQLLGSESKEGHKQMDSRVGAIHALAEISSQSDKQRRVVMEILAAYIETNAQEQVTAKMAQRGGPRVDSDIQAAINILVTRDTRYDPPNGWLDLSESSLAGVDFTAGADVSSVRPGKAGRFGRMRLVACNLDSAFLSHVDISQAVLQFASLKGAFLNKTILDEADVSYADFTGAYLIGASLRRTNLEGAKLDRADLSGADLTDARVSQIQINSATGDPRTRLPAGFAFPKAWLSR